MVSQNSGESDPEVAAAFRELVAGPSVAIAQAAEHLPIMIDDASLVRTSMLRALGDKPRDVRFFITRAATARPFM
jgi:hypothetical protein